MIFKEDGTSVIQFGTGDIEICHGLIDDPEEIVGTISFTQQRPGLIGAISERSERDGCECVLDDFSHTRLVFTKTESIDVLMNHLLSCKESMIKDEI